MNITKTMISFFVRQSLIFFSNIWLISRQWQWKLNWIRKMSYKFVIEGSDLFYLEKDKLSDNMVKRLVITKDKLSTVLKMCHNSSGCEVCSGIYFTTNSEICFGMNITKTIISFFVRQTSQSLNFFSNIWLISRQISTFSFPSPLNDTCCIPLLYSQMSTFPPQYWRKNLNFVKFV
jgi:hypothetical protein